MTCDIVQGLAERSEDWGRQKSHFFAGCCPINRASSEAVAGSGIRDSGCVGRKGHRLKRQRKPHAPPGLAERSEDWG
mgnify:FL=1